MISAINSKYTVVLASQSPRRRQLLSDLGIDFQVIFKSGINEDFPDDMPVEEVAKYLSKKKFDAYNGEISNNELIITADTVVIKENEILGKPTDLNNAKQMLRRLSGSSHSVITGVTIGTSERNISFDANTDVRFSELSENEIDYYIEHFRPLDKAGSYGIQEWIGYIGIESISGSFYNVMGLPIQQLYRQLINF